MDMCFGAMKVFKLLRFFLLLLCEVEKSVRSSTFWLSWNLGKEKESFLLTKYLIW